MAASGDSTGNCICLRGWWLCDGMAVVDLEGPPSIELLPRERWHGAICHGWFHILDEGERCAVYAADGRLFLRIGETRWDWAEDNVQIEHREHRWLRRPERWTSSAWVWTGGKLRLQATYPHPVQELVRRGVVLWEAEYYPYEDWWQWIAEVVAPAEGRETVVARWEAGFGSWPLET